MITYKTGDIFTSDMQVLVNPVNTVGIMGKGLAKHFKSHYPKMFEDYKSACNNGSLSIGQLHIFHGEEKWILNFPTKTHWRDKSKIEYIKSGMMRFTDIYQAEQIESIAFPMLGCGLGGLNWTQVKPIMETTLGSIDIPIEIYVTT